MNTWKKIDLGGRWDMTFEHEEKLPCSHALPRTMEQLHAFPAAQISAQVPGNFEIDLQKAGLLDDPFYADNILKVQKLEDCHVWYSRKFTYVPVPHTKPKLVFEGLDTLAEIYLNGHLLGKTDNMLIPQEFDLTTAAEGENDLTIHFLPVCLESRKNKISAGDRALPYNYETLRLRKSPSMFGWDICPRIVSCGIWRPVYLEYVPEEHFKQSYLMTHRTDLFHQTASLDYFFDLAIGSDDISRYALSLQGQCDGHTFSIEKRLWFTAGHLDIPVKDALFWMPKGYGKQPLYQVKADLKKDGQVIDTSYLTLGIRTVSVQRTSITDEQHQGDFHFEVNGRKIFILGTNFVPIDSLHSRDRERLPEVTELLGDIGCNAIRIWGGGVYEDEFLYQYCDEHGILIWQDFMMACGQYPVDPDFQSVMANEALHVIRRLRQHPSLLLWAGDNECDTSYASYFGSQENTNLITRQVLPQVLREEDPSRPYLPSSPYIDSTAAKLPRSRLPENHLWGPRDYFRSSFYTGSLCSFASEIGYHGCSSEESIRKFIDPDHLWPYQNNDQWLLHCASPETGNDGIFLYRIDLMARQIRELFGMEAQNLSDFTLASQISQAEAMKFFIDMFRMQKDWRSGIIWWNLIDCWPQFSDAVVDYYFDKKLAYFYIQQVQQPVLLAMSEPENWHCSLKAVNDSGTPEKLSYRISEWLFQESHTCGKPVLKPVLSGTAVIGDQVETLDQVSFSHGQKKIFILDWQAGAYRGRNHYLCGQPPFDFTVYRTFLRQVYPQYLIKSGSEIPS